MFEGEIWGALVILISIGAVVISITLSRWANGRYLRPTISNWFMWCLFVYNYIGAVYLMLVRDSYEEAIGLFSYPEAIIGAWGLAVSGIILIPLGMNLANAFWGISPNSIWQKFVFKSRVSTEVNTPRLFHIAFVFLAIITLAVTLLYYQQIDVPLLGVFRGEEAGNLALLRSEAIHGFEGKYYRYNFFKTTVLTILVLISFFLRHNKAYRYAFWGLLGVRIIVCLAGLEKAPIVNLFILLLLAWYFEKYNFNKRFFMFFCLAMIGIIISMYVWFMGTDISNIDLFIFSIGAILRRVFVAQGVGVDWSIVYVERYGFLNGASLLNPAGILPFSHVVYSVELMEMVFPQNFLFMGQQGSMPTVFWGEVYANFGVWVTLFSMVVMGVVLRTGDILFQTRKTNNNMLNKTLYVFMIKKFESYVGTSVLGIMFDQDIWLTVIVVAFLSYLCRRDCRGVY